MLSHLTCIVNVVSVNVCSEGFLKDLITIIELEPIKSKEQNQVINKKKQKRSSVSTILTMSNKDSFGIRC